ncbi:MAG: S8/S53 family peptidase [Deltaproteobacteria bacterium]|nr:S8/S53 family peptidase [Deltaproteobacteria bacterium]
MIDPPPVLAEVFADGSGAGVCVAVVDSGINFAHPHLLGAGRGLAVERRSDALVVIPGAHADRFGHGTCCAALIHALAPLAEILAVRVTSDRPTTDGERLQRGLEVAAEEGARVLCVPLGARGSLGLDGTVEALARRGVVVVAPWIDGETRPGASPGALGVGALDGVDVALVGGRLAADPRPRPAPGIPRNFQGPSLATARVSAAVARWLQRLEAPPPEDLASGFKRALTVR